MNDLGIFYLRQALAALLGQSQKLSGNASFLTKHIRHSLPSFQQIWCLDFLRARLTSTKTSCCLRHGLISVPETPLRGNREICLPEKTKKQERKESSKPKKSTSTPPSTHQSIHLCLKTTKISLSPIAKIRKLLFFSKKE